MHAVFRKHGALTVILFADRKRKKRQIVLLFSLSSHRLGQVQDALGSEEVV